MASSPMIGGSDPAILKSLETQTPSVARTAPATVSATTGTATSSGSTVSRGLAPQVSGGTVTYNQATQATAGNSVTVTSSTSNDPADVVTIYTSPKAVSVSAINQTVNTYKVNNYSGNEYTDSNVANYLPTFTGNIGAGNVNVTGGVYTYELSATGLASLTTLNVSTTANLGAVGNVRITGGTSGQVLSTDGSGALSWINNGGGGSSYGNSNVAAYLPTYTGNIGGDVVSANLFVGSGANLTNIPAGNISGAVSLATYASTANAVAGANVSGEVAFAATANAVALANVSGAGNIASINLDGNVSNVLAGDGTWITAGGGGGGSSISDGTSNVSVTSTSGNVVIAVDNNAASWTFATDGIIYNKLEADYKVLVTDPNGDGYAVKHYVNDGTQDVTLTSLDESSFRIYTNLDGAGEEWRFQGNTLQVSTDSTIRGFDSNVVIESMSAGGTDIASLRSVSNQNDPNIFTTFDATPTGANIIVYNGGSNGGTGYTWQFDNTGNLTLPTGGNIIGNVTNANLSQYLNVSDVNNNFSYHVVLSAGSGDKSLHIDADDNLQYNPVDGLLTAVRMDADYFVGNLNFSNGYPAANLVGSISSIANGNSNVSVATANGNVTINSVGNTTMTITGTGANVTGTLTSTGKIGYASGSTVTQTTNRGNGVTINALAGTVVTVSATMVAGQIDTFTVANDQVDPNNDIVLAQIVSPNFGVYNCVAQPSATISSFLNGFYINIQNISGFTTTSDAITIRFMVIKAPNA